MSTILKALRRLEEDSPNAPANTGNPIDAAPTTDPLSADGLRDRILAEESVAQSIAAASRYDSHRTRRIARITAAATLLTIGLGVGVYVMLTRTSSEPIANEIAATRESQPVSTPEVDNIRGREGRAGIVALQAKTDRAVVSQKPAEEVPSGPNAASQPPLVPVPILVAGRSPTTSTQGSGVSRSTANEPPTRSAGATAIAPPSPSPTPTPADEEMALAAVTPTPATLSANSARVVAKPEASSTATLAKPPASRRRPKPRAIEKSPPSVSAPQPTASKSPTPPTSPRSAPKKQPAESKPAREPQPPKESKASPDPSPIEHLNRRVLPELTIIRTAWHPSADRRSAKIRLEDTDEILNLREGDAVGGLVIGEISPSAVVFKAGDVEIRRRVGHEESGN